MSQGEFHGIPASTKEQALRLAVANNWADKVKKLLADGVDVNAFHDETTPLCVAAGYGRDKLVELLLAAGANVNVPGRPDMTPLMHACSEGGKKGSKVALMLIQAGADVNYVRQDDGMTALKFAAKGCSPEVLQALIDYGAQVDGPPDTDQTALMLAARADDLEAIQVLVKNGADIHRPCQLPWAKGKTAEGVAELEGRKKAAKYLRGLRGG